MGEEKRFWLSRARDKRNTKIIETKTQKDSTMIGGWRLIH
jgi:hypothetical protein